MKNRLTLIFAALVVILGGMVWLMKDRGTAVAPAMAVAPDGIIRAEPAAEPVAPAIPRPAAESVAPLTVQTPPDKTPAMVRVGTSGDVKYVARSGDTVSQLAIALLGSDSREHRDAVVAANPSLQANPDRVLEGHAYSMTRASSAVVMPTAGSDVNDIPARSKPTSDEKAAASGGSPKLEYIAQPGDTVSSLASNLLGSDTRAKRDDIIAGNASLRQDPDHLVAGRSYTIIARNGLAADPDAAPSRPATTQPEADDDAKRSVGRMLRYTARPGDTVSKLAVALLGGDTSANRDLIIRTNVSLKQDPDHLVAGQTYWIAAPTADAKP